MYSEVTPYNPYNYKISVSVGQQWKYLFVSMKIHTEPVEVLQNSITHNYASF